MVKIPNKREASSSVLTLLLILLFRVMFKEPKNLSFVNETKETFKEKHEREWQEKLKEKNEMYEEELVGEKKMNFEIAPYSRQINLLRVTHERIREEATKIFQLTNEQKKNIDTAIYIEEYIAQTNTGRQVVFTGAWYCKPMKKYIKDMGYQISACGNDFDLCVTLKD